VTRLDVTRLDVTRLDVTRLDVTRLDVTRLDVTRLDKRSTYRWEANPDHFEGNSNTSKRIPCLGEPAS